MIRSLRQRHSRVAVVMGLLLPLAFAAGIAARRPVPEVSELPFARESTPHNYSEVEWDRAHLFPRTPALVSLLRDANATRFAVEVSIPEGFAKPDVLVYWYSGPQPGPRDIPADSVLLGACDACLPLPASAQAGRLLLYSLADHEILDTSQSFTLRKL